VHDFNPGIEQSGLFWTSVVALDNVRVNLNTGRATLEVRNLHMKDYFNLENATVGGGPRPRPAVVSYRVEWTATGPATDFDNPAQQYRGTLRSAAAQMAWSARTPEFDFVSAPIATSTTDAALLGHERNGSFY
jgi:hypothetical protein